MATEDISTIIVGGGGDYTTLAAWESGEQKDLVAADQIAVAECQTGESTTSVIIAGWTTDATRYVHVRNASGHHHLGDPTAGFRLAASNATAVFQIQNHVRVTGIVVVQTSGTAGIGIRANGGAESWVNECIVRNGGAGTFGIVIEVANSTGRYYNNIVYDWGTAGIRTNAVTNCIGHVYNNTVIDCATGILRTSGTMRPKNNIVQGGTTCFSGTMTAAETNLASDATGQIQATLTFVDASNDNFHLAASDTAAIDAGTDLSADGSLAFSTDIDGNTRPQGSAWDIGADERLAATRKPLLGRPA